MAKYSVGQKVRVCDTEKMKQLQLKDAQHYDIVPELCHYANKVLTIEEMFTSGERVFYNAEETHWRFHEDLLLPVDNGIVQNKRKDKFEYTVFDKVRVKSVEELESYNEIDSELYDITGDMFDLAGNIYTINDTVVIDGEPFYYLEEDEDVWCWHQDLLELVEEEPEYKTVNLEDISFGSMAGMGTAADDILDCSEVKKRQGGLDFSNVMDKIDAVANKVHEIKALIKELEDEGLDVQFDKQTVGTKVGTRFYGRDLTMENDVE